MRKFIQNKLKDQKGLTLIELLAVIVILAIIAAIAIPAIGNIIENSRLSAVKSDATNGISAANVYFTDNPDKTSVTTLRLITDGYLDSPGKLPVGVAGKEDAATSVTAANADYPTLIFNTNPLKISTQEIDFSGGKKVKFSNATVKGINDNAVKGNAVLPATPLDITQ